VALTEDQLYQLRRKVGTAPDDATLNALYEQLDDVDQVAIQVLSERRADLVRKPSSFTIPGDYSESRSAEQLKALDAELGTIPGGPGSLQMVDPPAPRIR
jgi:hypothetical protein